MDTATNQSKRTRIDATAQATASSATSKPKSPMAHADKHIEEHVASLLPNIATILEKLSKDHLRLRAKANNKSKQINKMTTDEEYIPRSARVAFKLTGSKMVAESPEYIALQTETNEAISVSSRNL